MDRHYILISSPPNFSLKRAIAVVMSSLIRNTSRRNFSILSVFAGVIAKKGPHSSFCHTQTTAKKYRLVKFSVFGKNSIFKHEQRLQKFRLGMCMMHHTL